MWVMHFSLENACLQQRKKIGQKDENCNEYVVGCCRAVVDADLRIGFEQLIDEHSSSFSIYNMAFSNK